MLAGVCLRDRSPMLLAAASMGTIEDLVRSGITEEQRAVSEPFAMGPVQFS